jgi:hypothetical protein
MEVEHAGKSSLNRQGRRRIWRERSGYAGEKVDFGRVTGRDCENVGAAEERPGIDREKFIVWLLTNHQPMGKDHSRNLAYCINMVRIDEGKTI